MLVFERFGENVEVFDERPRSNTNGGGESEKTVTSTPHNDKNVEDRQTDEASSTRNVDIERGV